MTAVANQTARYERKREEILDAAVILFNARGLSGATMADVAAAVGLTTTSVTYYYRKKEDLAAACVMRAISAMDELLDESEAAPAAPERLREFIRRYFALLADVAEQRRPALMNFWELRAMVGPQAQTAIDAYVSLFRRFRLLFSLECGPAFSRAEQNARAHLVLSAVLWSKEWVRRYDAEDYPRAAERFADVLIGGLAGPGSRWEPLSLESPTARAVGGDVSPDAFLRIATELVNEQGYRGASVDRISERLNVTKGSFYHHNENKDELVAQCYGRTFDVMRQAHRAAFSAEGSGWTRLCAFSAALVRYQLSDQGPLLRHSALAAMPEAMRPRFSVAVRRQSERLAGIVADAIADGSIRPVDPVIAAQVITGTINATAELPKWSPTVTEETAVEMFLRPAMTGLFTTAETTSSPVPPSEP